MKLIKKFINNLKRYRVYIILASKSELKVQVANTFLGYFWWILDPFLHMLIYTLLVTFIMARRDVENFALFAFCALLPWKWVTTTLTSSTDCIRKRASILQQVYLPKLILPIIVLSVNFIKFITGISVILFLLYFYKVPLSLHFFEVIPVIISNALFLYGIALFLAHFGVYVTDTRNMINHIIRLWFYLSPGIYSINRIPEKYRFLWWLNPMTTYFESYRNVFMYSKSPHYPQLVFWTLFSMVIIYLGLILFDKYDKNYSKVI